MADLTDLQAAQTIKVIGSDSGGVETNPLVVDSNGNLKVGLTSDGTNVATVTAPSTAPVATDRAVVVAISPNATITLPTGASTSALQTTGNTSLSNIDAKLPTTIGQKAMAASLAVTIASDQSATTSSLANGAYVSVTSSATQILAANANRKSATIKNTGLTTACIGVTGVTTSTGFPLAAGETMVLNAPHVPTNAIFAIRLTTDTTVHVQETT